MNIQGGQRDDVRSHGTRCWEPNLGPLGEQPACGMQTYMQAKRPYT